MKFIIIFLSMTILNANALEFKGAKSVIKDAKGKILGEVVFKRLSDSLQISGTVKNLGKGTTHGIHIHENGTCVGDFKAAGAHYDPTNEKKHGHKDMKSHYGDLGNIKADKNGISKFTKKSKKLFIDVDRYSIIGRSVIIHEGKDDLTSQPSGNSGKRIACGVIDGLKPKS